MQQRGFTLIELLVVMAVMSILVSLLMPAISAARAQAWSVSCRSRLAQIGYAVQMYGINHGDYLPGAADSSGRQFFGFRYGPTERVDFTDGYMTSYVGDDPEVWQCPTLAEFLPRADGPCTSYAYNYNYLTDLVTEGDWWDPGYQYWWRGKKAAVIQKPSRTVLFGDSATNWMGPVQENWFWTPPSQALPWGNAYTHFRHRLRANILWADGHVNSMEPDKRLELDKDNLGVICDESDVCFDPKQ